jgi:hypothetical protein
MQGVLPALAHVLTHLASEDVVILPSKVELHGQMVQVVV